MNYDVVVAGAGPAGISSAVALVRRDPSLRHRILVLDRAAFPREKPCGGGLTGHAEEAMAALGLELPAKGAWRSDAMLYDFSPMTEGLRGYLWVFPVAGEWLNVGLMHDPSAPLSGGDLEALLRRHLDRLGITLPRAARGWPAFGYHPSAPIGGAHLLTVGDAAGIDALTGEGIAVGMEQAQVAADAILGAFDSGDF